MEEKKVTEKIVMERARDIIFIYLLPGVSKQGFVVVFCLIPHLMFVSLITLLYIKTAKLVVKVLRVCQQQKEKTQYDSFGYTFIYLSTVIPMRLFCNFKPVPKNKELQWVILRFPPTSSSLSYLLHPL